MQPSSDFSHRISRWLWAAALVSLPVTSFRWFPFLGETTYVRPLALYPLALLLPLLLIQSIRRERLFPWTGSVTLLAVFAAAVVAATGLGLLPCAGRNIRDAPSAPWSPSSSGWRSSSPPVG